MDDDIVVSIFNPNNVVVVVRKSRKIVIIIIFFLKKREKKNIEWHVYLCCVCRRNDECFFLFFSLLSLPLKVVVENNCVCLYV